jgi:hypothetical protein
MNGDSKQKRVFAIVIAFVTDALRQTRLCLNVKIITLPAQ